MLVRAAGTRTRGCASTRSSTATHENLEETRRADELPVRALPEDGSPQPRDHPRRPEEPVAPGTAARRTTTRSDEHLREVWAAARARTVRRDRRSDAALGEGAKTIEQADAGRPVPAGRADGRRLRQRRRQRLRDPRAAREPPQAVVLRDLWIRRAAKQVRATSRRRSASARTRSSCGRASRSSRASWSPPWCDPGSSRRRRARDKQWREASTSRPARLSPLFRPCRTVRHRNRSPAKCAPGASPSGI